MVFGDDFRWCNAHQYFRSLDKLIYNFNLAYTDVKLQYSTPSKYIDAISSNGNEKIAWPTKYDDMFPYADTPESFWTGYFTSRANAKGYVRRGSSNMHAVNKLFGQEVIDQTKDQTRILNVINAESFAADQLGIL